MIVTQFTYQHISTSERKTSQDATAQHVQERLCTCYDIDSSLMYKSTSTATTPEVQPQDLYKSANTAIFDDHEGFHRPDQGAVAPSSATPSMFQGARGFNISGNPHFVNIGSVINNLGGSHGSAQCLCFVDCLDLQISRFGRHERIRLFCCLSQLLNSGS